jgi:hypothetical protein
VPSNNGLERTRQCLAEPRRSTQCWADRKTMGSVSKHAAQVIPCFDCLPLY